MKKKGFLIVIPVIAVIGIMFFLGIKRYNESFNNFQYDGYVIDNTANSTSSSYYFNKDSKYKVVSARDYKKNTITNIATGEVTETGLPESNVLYYDLEDDAWLCVRPSGTEPKIKFYYGIKGQSLEDADQLSDELGAEVIKMIKEMIG